jgi:hypothetical protein
MGILDNVMAAPQIAPDIMAMMGGNQQPGPAQVSSALPQLPQQQAAPQPTQPRILDAATAQKNPALVQPGVIVNGHLFKGGDKADEANWQMLTGDEYMNTIPQSEQIAVKQMVAGRMPFPGARSLTTPYWQKKLQEAQQFDPNFDAVAWDGRVKTARDYSPGGKVGQTLQSGSTAINHLGHLNSQIGDVSGVGLPLIGGYVNHAINAYNAPQGKLNPYMDTQGHLAEETTKFYRGTGGAESDVLRNMSNLSPDLSTEAKQGGVNNTVQLIYGKLKPLADAYNTQMGTSFPVSHFLPPDAVKTLKTMGFDPETGEKTAKPSASPTKGGSGGFVNGQAYTDKHGNTATYLNGKWVQH